MNTPVPMPRAADLDLLRAETFERQYRQACQDHATAMAEIKRLQAENSGLILTLQQPDQVGYWQRRCEIAEERCERLRALLREVRGDINDYGFADNFADEAHKTIAKIDIALSDEQAAGETK